MLYACLEHTVAGFRWTPLTGITGPGQARVSQDEGAHPTDAGSLTGRLRKELPPCPVTSLPLSGSRYSVDLLSAKRPGAGMNDDHFAGTKRSDNLVQRAAMIDLHAPHDGMPVPHDEDGPPRAVAEERARRHLKHVHLRLQGDLDLGREAITERAPRVGGPWGSRTTLTPAARRLRERTSS